ncbi:MAG TPA: UTP--glucose-1-phosphate uridylyltransferase [Peptococcaceae bacterium]|nr:MAG: UDP-glucose pyrophosphorylase [Clostridia bacterium 41_269]HBT20543.1 UTP--glucose-1-phosphate uridylyltransferase [Peptococcaceae bacterium]
MKITKAVIPAAGLGTRFLPATKAQPKEMLPIVDKPAIQYIVEEAVASGIEDILIITGRGKRAIEDHFDRAVELELLLEEKGNGELLKMVREISNMADIHYIRQKEPKGLGHAIYCARKFIGNEPFAVLLGDDIVRSEVPCLKQLINVYERYQVSILGVQEVKKEEVSRYGIVKVMDVNRNGVLEIEDLIEKPKPEEAPSNLAIMGRYILTPEIFEALEKTQPGTGGEVQLTDALKELRKKQSMFAYIFKGKRYDVGDKLGYLIATVEFALDRKDISKDFEGYLKTLVKGD